VLHTKCYSAEEIRKDELCGSCGPCGREEKCMQGFVGKRDVEDIEVDGRIILKCTLYMLGGCGLY